MSAPSIMYGPGGDDVAPVLGRLGVAPGDLLRDRRRRRHRQAVEEVAHRLGELEGDGLVVGRRDAGDRVGLARGELLHALDDVVVEGVLGATLGVPMRSKEYLMSCEVTSRFTGGPKVIPSLSVNV